MAEAKELDLFSTKEEMKDIVGMQYIEYHPLSSNGCCMEFQIPPASSHYVDLDHSMLKVSIQLKKADGTNLVDTDKVGLTNNVMNTLFSQVDVTFNDLNVSPAVGSNHPYKAYLDTLLDEAGRKGAAQRHLCEGYRKLVFTSEAQAEFNNNVQSWGAKVLQGKTFTMMGKLKCDAFNLGKCIPNGVNIKIKLYQNTDKFRITAEEDGEYKLTIKDISLKVCHVKLSNEELIKQDREFQRGPAKFDYVRSDVSSFQIPSGSYNAKFENLYGGRVPVEVIVGLVSADGYGGKINKNPLRFQHFNLNRIALTVDGVSVPGPPLEPDYTEMNYVESHLSLFKEGDRCDVDIDPYPVNHCLYRFDLETYANEDTIPLLKSGNVRITVQFSEALPSGATLIVYSKFADRFLIDKERNVYQDEAAAPYLKMGY